MGNHVSTPAGAQRQSTIVNVPTVWRAPPTGVATPPSAPVARARAVQDRIIAHMDAIKTILANKSTGLDDTQAKHLDRLIRDAILPLSDDLQNSILGQIVKANLVLEKESKVLNKRVTKTNSENFELITKRDTAVNENKVLKDTLKERNQDCLALQKCITDLHKQRVKSDAADATNEQIIRLKDQRLSELTTRLIKVEHQYERLIEWQEQLRLVNDRFQSSNKRQRRDAVSEPDNFPYPDTSPAAAVDSQDVTMADNQSTTHEAAVDMPATPSHTGTQLEGCIDLTADNGIGSSPTATADEEETPGSSPPSAHITTGSFNFKLGTSPKAISKAHTSPDMGMIDSPSNEVAPKQTYTQTQTFDTGDDNDIAWYARRR
ncbi:hypothetical protein CAC42_8282 [Sphaceloma murrayae]|uniref:Uncharacterized protein n=1 Tax=Sphaceloma murrayae TaxID=2082308 RepID=A0A2K1QJZ5_9PEZI|nr:hypothetical protein CAC42_8282 [Sphaceloma murrayae]